MSKIGKIRPLKFYSEKVLPLVYDNSLSYYEVLGKVVRKLNDLIEFLSDNIRIMLEPFMLQILYNESTQTINFDVIEEDDENA